MEKLYTQEEYQIKSDEANKKGLFLYQLVSEKEYIEEVLEWEKKIIEIEIIDPETGEPTGKTQLQEVNDYDRPIMIEEEIINPETGLKEIVIVQKHHSELKTKKVANLIIANKDYYICFEKNYTYGKINPNYEAEQEAKRQKRIQELSMTKSDFFDGMIKAFGLDQDDLQPAIELILAQLQISEIDKKVAMNNYKNAKDFYRKHTLFTLLSDREIPITETQSINVSSSQWDRFFDKTNKGNEEAYKELLGE